MPSIVKRVDLKAEFERWNRPVRTQTDIAKQMRITRFYLCNLLAGKKPWTERTARDFAFATGIPLAAILGDGQREEAIA